MSLGYQTACQSCNSKIRSKAIVFMAHNASIFHHKIILDGLTRETAKLFKIMGGISSSITGLLFMNRVKFLDTNNFVAGTLEEIYEQHTGIITSPDQYVTKYMNLCVDWDFNINHVCAVLNLEEFKNEVLTTRLSDSDTSEGINVFSDTSPSVDPDTIRPIRPFYKNFITNYRNETVVHHYMNTRIYIIAEVMADFVKWCMGHFLITPLQCFGLGAYSFHCAFANVDQGYEYIRNTEMLRVIQDNIRGKDKKLQNALHLI